MSRSILEPASYMYKTDPVSYVKDKLGESQYLVSAEDDSRIISSDGLENAKDATDGKGDRHSVESFDLSKPPPDNEPVQWKHCKNFGGPLDQVLDSQFGNSQSSLKLTVAYSNGLVKVYEILDSMDLKNWQLQAEFQNITDSVTKFGKGSCSSASISWSSQISEIRPASFVLGFNSDTSQLNSPKVWEFDQDHQRWLPVAELADPGDKGDRVYAVAWAPNIGRPYELIAVSTSKGISIWQMASNPDPNGRLSVEKAVTFPCIDNEVWQMEWDMSGMTLATTGVWHEQAVIEPTT